MAADDVRSISAWPYAKALIESFLATDVNMIHISGRDELTELAGKGDGKEVGKCRLAPVGTCVGSIWCQLLSFGLIFWFRFQQAPLQGGWRGDRSE